MKGGLAWARLYHMKIKLIRNCIYTSKGDEGAAGQIVDTDDKNARFLIDIRKAEKFIEVPDHEEEIATPPVIDEEPPLEEAIDPEKSEEVKEVEHDPRS